MALLSVWVLAAGYFGLQLMAFDSTPGARAMAPQNWPVESAILRRTGHMQLLMFVHPECTCSIASLEQLRTLASQLGSQLETHVVLWHRSVGANNRNWPKESGGAAIVDDQNGSEARRFGAKTSGQTLIYDEVGRLIYAGGLTVLRGEAGGEPVLRIVISRLRTRVREPYLERAVFGCPISRQSAAIPSGTYLWTRLLQ